MAKHGRTIFIIVIYQPYSRTRMKAPIIMLCLIGAAVANPIFNILSLDSNSGENNSTMSLSDSHSSENNTSSVEQSSESSESLESNSEDKTSEESESHSLEDPIALIDETRDNNSEEDRNVRKSWLSVFASVVHSRSGEDSSKEATGQLVTPPPQTSVVPILPSNQPGSTIAPANKNQMVPDVSPTAAGDSSESSEGPDNTNSTNLLVGVTEAHNSSESSSSSSESSESSQSKSSESSESSESSSSESKESSQSSSSESMESSQSILSLNSSSLSKSIQSNSSESNESSESSESSQSKVSSESRESNETISAASDSSEDSQSSDSTNKKQIQSKDCSQGAKGDECESEEEYFFQDIGDDAQYPLEHLMALKDNLLLELSWRR
ncbi:unnamed protein product [Arctogadus glacialis]